MRIIQPERHEAPAQRTATEKKTQKLFPLKEKNSHLRACGENELRRLIVHSYGAGDMDKYEPYPQVWFTADELVQRLRESFYELPRESVREYLSRWVECGQMERRESITENRIEYRRLKF